MRISLMACGMATALVSVAIAQTIAPPTFDVALIKLDEGGGNHIDVTPGALIARGASLTTCITWAYGVQISQVTGANSAVSGLLNSDRYSIVAKTAGPVAESQLKLMLQALLAERFKLVLHKEPREVRTFALVVEKSGPKFHESQGDGESAQQASSKLARRWKWTSMPQFADSLADAMQAPVIDQTGLTGKYDFALDLTPFLPPSGERPEIGGMMVTAIHEQLGLKLDSRKATAEVLVVDHLEKPTAN